MKEAFLQIINGECTSISILLFLVKCMSSEYPPDIRMSASTKLVISIKKLSETKKGIIRDALFTRLTITKDTWEQRNIVEVLASCIEKPLKQKLLSILQNPHIDGSVRKRGQSLLLKEKPDG